MLQIFTLGSHDHSYRDGWIFSLSSPKVWTALEATTDFEILIEELFVFVYYRITISLLHRWAVLCRRAGRLGHWMRHEQHSRRLCQRSELLSVDSINNTFLKSIFWIYSKFSASLITFQTYSNKIWNMRKAFTENHSMKFVVKNLPLFALTTLLKQLWLRITVVG